MNVTQHVPDFVDTGQSPRAAQASTLSELLAIDWVKTWEEDGQFSRFSLADGCLLMAEYSNGARWYVVATLSEPELYGLPVWSRVMQRGTHGNQDR